MAQRDTLLRLIQQLYAAPATHEGWRAFLDDLRVAIQGSAVSFISHDLRGPPHGVALTSRTDPAALNGYIGHWGAVDPWA